MTRVKRGVVARARHKKILALAKGYRGRRAYRDRRQRKRQFRSLWIVRINAACRELGMTYSRFINGLSRASVSVDRKVLSNLATHDKVTFAKFVDIAKANLA